jgi:hypothetical protein
MDYSVRDVLLKSLVNVLKPAKRMEKIEPIECNYYEFKVFKIDKKNMN